MRSILVFLFVGCVCIPASAGAETPFQFAAPGLRAPDDPYVNGVRLSVIEGRNQRVRGLDFGFFAWSETGSLAGFSSVLGVGRIHGDVRGCATGVVNLHDGRDRGLNAAFFNQVRRMDNGANVGFLNLVDEFSQVDVGAVNLSDRSTVQVGVLNMTRRIEAVQLGFLNFADNGFLPIFPFFNFPRN